MIKNLKAIRKMRGLTQGQLAKATGINMVTICKYESGKVDPTLTSAAKMAAVLGVTVDDLIGGANGAVSDSQPSGGKACG